MRKSWALCLPLAVWGINPAAAISTYKDWDGTTSFAIFGCRGSPTYGETFKVPSGKNYLDKFTVSISNIPNEVGPPIVVRAEVYEWHGEKATGDGLYESAPITISFQDHYIHFHKITFKPAALHLVPGKKYVFFVTMSKDANECLQQYETVWGGIPDGNPYVGGKFVVFNGNDPASWTTTPWLSWKSVDLAFHAHFSR